MHDTESRRNNRAMILRDYAGVLVCSITVISFIAVGFMVMFAKLVFASDASPPGEWLAAMLSLASTALGFLAGQRRSAQEPQAIPAADRSEPRACVCSDPSQEATRS